MALGSALKRHELAPSGPEGRDAGTPVSGAGAGLPPPPPPPLTAGLHGDELPPALAEADLQDLHGDPEDDANGGIIRFAEEEVGPGCLPADLLRRIADRIDDAADFVRFHSACKSWRSAACPPGNTLLPWLLAPRYGDDDRLLRFRLVFSGRTLHLPCPARLGAQSVVMDTSSVATRGRLFIVGPANDACLVNPLGGATTPLPQLPDHLWLDEAATYTARCTVSADESVVMCTAPPCPASRIPVVLASILEQEDGASCAWKPWIDVTVHWPELQWSPVSPPRFYALYHQGRIICGDEEPSCMCVLPVSEHPVYCGTGMAAVWVSPPPLPAGKMARSTFVLETAEALLWVRVLMPAGNKFSDEEVCQRLSLSVHALQVPGNGERPDGAGWINKELVTMRDRTLFLSPRSSFCMEGVGAASGCAYFLYDNMKSNTQEPICSVYKYEFLGGITSLVEELPQGWNANSVWFAPRPIVAACQ